MNTVDREVAEIMDGSDIDACFKDLPIITLGDDLQGILGINSTDSSIFTDILLRKDEKKDELDSEIKSILDATETKSIPEEIIHISNEIESILDVAKSETKDVLDTEELIEPGKIFHPFDEVKSILNATKTETKDILDVEVLIEPGKIIDTSDEIKSILDELSNVKSSSLYKPSSLALEYESLARSVLVPSPSPSDDDTYQTEDMYLSYTCSICSKSFPDRRYLNRHFSKHTNRFTCPHCQRSFSRKESMLKHIPRCEVLHPEPRKRKKKKASVGVPKFKCDECLQQFTRKENYSHHMLKHSNFRVRCNECQKTLCSWKSFLSHKKSHEFTRTVYFCDHCAAVFMFKSNLRRHLRLAQKVKNTIVCSGCNLAVKNKEHLDKHRCETVKLCVICSQPFCLENDIRKHRKVLHPELWFKCKMCVPGITFTARSEHHLQNHVRKAHKVSLTFMNCYEEGWYVKCD